MFLSQLIQNFDCMRQWTLLRCFHWLNLQSKSLPHFGQSLGGNQPDCCFCGKIHDLKSKIKKHIRKYHSSVDRGKFTRAWWKRYLRAGVSCSTIRGKPATTSLCESMHKSSVVEVGESSCAFCEKVWKMAKTSATILKHNSMTKTYP